MKQLVKIFSICTCIIACLSCSEKPDIEDYTHGEELRYAGKANDPAYFAGQNRLALQFVLGPDPNVCRALIYWNLRADSINISFDRAQLPSDTITQLIENLPENTYSFEIFTFDVYGNMSVPAYLTARTYDVRYRNSLVNREVNSYSYDEATGNVVINWGEHLMKSVGVKVEYTDTDNVPRTVFADSSVNVTTLQNVDVQKAPVLYQTLYKPEPTAIDSFSPGINTLCDINSLIIEVAKPYAVCQLAGFDPEVRFQPATATDALWNNRIARTATPYAYATLNNESGGWMYTGPANATSPTWITLDIKSKVRLQRFKLNHFYPYLSFGLKQWEFYAYKGSGTPTAAVGWNNWEKIGEYDNSKDPGISYNNFTTVNAAMNTAYAAGETLVYTRETAPLARYYRIKGLSNWEGAYQFSLSEVTFYKFAFE